MFRREFDSPIPHQEMIFMSKTMHLFFDPEDVVIETIGDEIILCIDRGFKSERSFTFTSVDIVILDANRNIIMGIRNPGQFDPFFLFKEISVVIEEIDGAQIGSIEMVFE